MEYTTVTNMKVRDYECDIQGVVNNSVYQQYLEHARHEFLLDAGINFAELAKQSINLVVVRVELDYKQALRPGDAFWVGTRIERHSKIRFDFVQGIYREGDNTLMLEGRVRGAAVNERGRPFLPESLLSLLGGKS